MNKEQMILYVTSFGFELNKVDGDRLTFKSELSDGSFKIGFALTVGLEKEKVFKMVKATLKSRLIKEEELING